MKVSVEKLCSKKIDQDSFKRDYGFKGRKENLVPLIIEDDQSLQENLHGDERNRINRKSLLKEKAPEPFDFAYERAIGENDSVYSNFIDLIYEAKTKVGRIAVIEGNSVDGYATGFMVSNKLMLTNWHVLSNKNEAINSTIEFNYEYDKRGNLKESITFGLAPEVFFYSDKSLDFCLVAVKQTDLANQHSLSEIGSLYLSPSSGKIGDIGKESLNIIHHPNGNPKQLSIRENKFIKVLSNAIWYESDTSQGSSGAPVFNDQWQLVALHHMGIASKDNSGDYLDKKGHPIPRDANNKIDISKIHWIANEGIRVSSIRKRIAEIFPNNPLIDAVLKNSTPVQSSLEHNLKIDSNSNQNSSVTRETVNISIPSYLLESTKKLSFNISSKISKYEKSISNIHLTEFESLRLERTINYKKCTGYKNDFLGTGIKNITIPKPKKHLKNRIAKIIGSNAYILKYHKFSVIFDSFHQMPFISAINIDGDEGKRTDFTKRNDKWIRDRRISLSAQLDNDFYYKSGFDRGHMSRREDANWGDTANEAKLNADLTCVYTNACPQVPALNRSNQKGLWGKIEKIILEKGAIKQNGKTGKITVFSGPIFSDTDPVLRAVSIPMSFYKIVIWLTDNHELKATAFILTQSELISSIDYEAIDIDQNNEFKEYHCSIQHLEERTGLDFSEIQEFDTFKGADSQFEIKKEKTVLKELELK